MLTLSRAIAAGQITAAEWLAPDDALETAQVNPHRAGMAPESAFRRVLA